MKIKKFLILPLFILYILFSYTILKMYSADVNITSAERALSKGEVPQALNEANKAVSKNPYEPSYYRRRAKIILTYTLGKNEEEQKRLKELALKDLEWGLRLNPNNLATLRNSAPLYMVLSVKDLSNPIGPQNLDPQYIESLRNFLIILKEKYPDDAGVFVAAAKIEKRTGLKEDLRKTLEKIGDLRPDLVQWHPDLID